MYKNILTFYYFVVVFSSVYLWSIKLIGTLSIRVPLFFINFILILILSKRKIKNTYLLIFPLLFIIFSFLSVINDDFGKLDLFLADIVFSRFLISYMLVALTLVLVPKYFSFKKAIGVLILVASFNSLIIFGQFLNIDYVWIITDVITANRYEDIDLLLLVDLKGAYKGLVGTVKSGYLLCLLIPLILYKIAINDKKIFWTLFFLFNILIVILLQQRMAFLIIILNTVYYIYFFNIKNNKSIYFIFFSVFSLVICLLHIFGYNIFIFDTTNSRLSTLEDESRRQLFDVAINFILDRPFFGGFDSFYPILNLSPHNLFLNAWIRGGIVGFISILIMVVFIFKKSSNVLRRGNLTNPLYVFLILAFLNYILLSFTHNEGITSADGITFILLAFFILVLDIIPSINPYSKN